jgi:hypothetical protein
MVTWNVDCARGRDQRLVGSFNTALADWEELLHAWPLALFLFESIYSLGNAPPGFTRPAHIQDPVLFAAPMSSTMQYLNETDSQRAQEIVPQLNY